ncbi:MAG: hypothetical protein J6X66_11895 [Lachnospiraceae bacterium]|nr:hypothetical protein [Lachnospiraceae bacterium]
MKSLFSMYRLRMNALYKSALWVIPVVSLAVFLAFMYGIIPVQISGSFLLSSMYLYIVSAFAAMSIQDRENDVTEEVLFLHASSKIKYYIARELVLLSIMILFGVILLFYPVIRSLSADHFFSRPLEVTDVVRGGLLILGSGSCGIALGDLLHRRIIRQRKIRIIALIAVSLIAIVKTALTDNHPAAGILHVIVPPVIDGFVMTGDSDHFDKAKTVYIFIHMMAFYFVTMFIKWKLLSLRRFEK